MKLPANLIWFKENTIYISTRKPVFLYQITQVLRTTSSNVCCCVLFLVYIGVQLKRRSIIVNGKAEENTAVTIGPRLWGEHMCAASEKGTSRKFFKGGDGRCCRRRSRTKKEAFLSYQLGYNLTLDRMSAAQFRVSLNCSIGGVRGHQVFFPGLCPVN